MKLTIVSIFIFSCAMISCSKTNTELNINKEELSGAWLLKQYAGGIAYQVIIPTDRIIIIFDKTGSYTSKEMILLRIREVLDNNSFT